jgi:hypothetical protein
VVQISIALDSVTAGPIHSASEPEIFISWQKLHCRMLLSPRPGLRTCIVIRAIVNQPNLNSWVVDPGKQTFNTWLSGFTEMAKAQHDHTQ